MMGHRFEIELRPVALGGGWRLHSIGRDPETGVETELGGDVSPIEPGVGVNDLRRCVRNRRVVVGLAADEYGIGMR
ncbi:hypothetical protein DYQ86_15545 [Acidobacteria bacterium AB60]|nr:hypothetical protein DYQ86_15545 [Acidobacteria bacterium AB60]